MSEWCSKGPTLEEDIAMSNISLDLFGQANGFYENASKLDGTKTKDDLADLSSDELLEIVEDKIQGLEEANKIIMKAREDWFNDIS